MILLAVVRVASAAAALFGLPVIVAANLLLRCPAWAYTASTSPRTWLVTPVESTPLLPGSWYQGPRRRRGQLLLSEYVLGEPDALTSARPDLCGGYQAPWYPYRDHAVQVRMEFAFFIPLLASSSSDSSIQSAEWCDQLVYESQREKSNDRALRRAQAIRMKPGGSANMREPLPDKPKRMHWLTCDWAATASCEALH
jgi:hypothetical protein